MTKHFLNGCDHITCKFITKSRKTDRKKGSCSLDLGDAIVFFDNYSITTCELGLGEKLVKNEKFTKNAIKKLKRGEMI